VVVGLGELSKVDEPLSGLLNGAAVTGAVVVGGAVLLEPGVEPGTGCNGAVLVGAGVVDDGLTGSVPEVGVTRESACANVNVSTAGATVPASLVVGPDDDRVEASEPLVELKLLPVERNGLPLVADDGNVAGAGLVRSLAVVDGLA
jgi:hypothetical protein